MTRSALIILLLFASVASAEIRKIGTYGAVYPIRENNALEEMQRKARQADMSQFQKEARKKIENATLPTTPLPRCETADRYLVDMTYTTPIDIPDKDGGILYPKGFQFNPLDYMDFDRTLVFLNGNDPKQVAWFKQSEHFKDLKIKVLITEGKWMDLSQTFERQVFYALPIIVDRFGLKAVPSVCRQNGKFMEVEEIAIQ